MTLATQKGESVQHYTTDYVNKIRNQRTLLHRCWQMLRIAPPGGSTLLCEMTSWPPS